MSHSLNSLMGAMQGIIEGTHYRGYEEGYLEFRLWLI